MAVALGRALERASAWHYLAEGSSSPPETWTGYVWQGMQQVYEAVVLAPLARLYLYGPAWGPWGFWSGLDLPAICTQKTHVSSAFWEYHPDEGLRVISKDFYSLVVLGETLLYFVLVWGLLRVACQGLRCAVRYPLSTRGRREKKTD